ncbi:MAG: hypothetical protein K6F37_01390, partial [Lachnospiraceae bacterium]|nr:hypothetical protein [Lachnospiraceae bacterium]
LYREHREYFYDWCEIGSIYGAPGDCLWGGGRVGFGEAKARDVVSLMREYGISARLTFSNSLLNEKHLDDRDCNKLCVAFMNTSTQNSRKTLRTEGVLQNGGTRHTDGLVQNGVKVHSDLLMDYIRKEYPGFYFVSSTTKVLTDFRDFEKELKRQEFKYVVPDFRLNRDFKELDSLPDELKGKVEFLCNECCWFECYDRKACYENVSRKSLGEECEDHVCVSPTANRGYRFSDAMKNPGFIGIEDIKHKYMPMGFSQFKIEGRSLGSAVVLEMLLYYITKPEYRLNIREEIYLDSMLDLF